MTPTAPQEAPTSTLVAFSIILSRVVARARAMVAAPDAGRWAMG